MARAKHIHKYYRATTGYTTLWACALPSCTHYMPKHLENLMNGKLSICWECGNQMVLHPGNMNMDKPVCDLCRTGIEPTEVDNLPLSDAMKNFITKKVG